LVPVASSRRSEANDILQRGVTTYPGGFLYHPMIIGIAAIVSPMHDVAPTLPYTKTKAFPISFLNPKPYRRLSLFGQDHSPRDKRRTRDVDTEENSSDSSRDLSMEFSWFAQGCLLK